MRTIPQTELMQDLQTWITKVIVAPLLNVSSRDDCKLPLFCELDNQDKQLIYKIAHDVCSDTVDDTYAKILLIGEKIVDVFQDRNIPTLTESSLLKGDLEIEKFSLQNESEYWGTQRKIRNNSNIFVIHGPPGAGKSTLLSKFPMLPNAEIFDTESLGKTLDEIKEGYLLLPIPKPNQIRICTSAHLFREFGTDAYRILILPPLSTYIDRLEKRNDAIPDKLYQGEMRSYAKWHARKPLVDLHLENLDPLVTIDKICSFVRRHAG